VHVGSSPHDDTRADVANDAGCEDSAVDDRQDRRLDGRSDAQAEVSLKVRQDVEIPGRVKCCRVVSVVG